MRTFKEVDIVLIIESHAEFDVGPLYWLIHKSSIVSHMHLDLNKVWVTANAFSPPPCFAPVEPASRAGGV